MRGWKSTIMLQIGDDEKIKEKKIKKVNYKQTINQTSSNFRINTIWK